MAEAKEAIQAVLSKFPHITQLKPEELGVSAAQLGVHEDQDILDGRFSLVFGSPESWLLNPKWRRMLTSSATYKDNILGIVG